MNNENQQPLSTQGDSNDKEEQLGGATNLSLDQLKQEGGIANSTEDNPDSVEDRDDLNEIRADDDLNEPDADTYQTGLDDDDELTDDDDTDEEDRSVLDTDGNGGYPDEDTANTTSTNS